jgi:hypothetical protein
MKKKYGNESTESLSSWYERTAGVKLAVKGIVLEVDQNGVKNLRDRIHADYSDVMPFRIAKNYGEGGKKDMLAVIASMDQFELVRLLQTRGVDDKVTNGEIVKALKEINSLARINIVGAGADFVEFSFLSTPSDWNAVARKCAEISPNMITFGTGSLAALEREIMQFNGAILWWY